MLQSIIPIILDQVLSRIPDPEERERAKRETERLLLEASIRQQEEQAKINQAEAQHPSIFVSGWRPFIGWVCGIGIAWAFVGAPIASWAMLWLGKAVSLPSIDTSYLFELVLAMLGLGGLRSFEKLKGIARR